METIVPSKSILELKDIANVIGLAMVSGFVGLSVGDLAQNFESSLVIGGIFLFLWVFAGGMNDLAEDLYFKRKGPAILRGSALIGLAVVAGIGIGDILGNPFVWVGIFGGWIIVFLLSVFRGDGHTVDEVKWHD
ncbi:MAG: hypothetical protein ABJM58_07805 [Alteripontixanthobacter sp.]